MVIIPKNFKKGDIISYRNKMVGIIRTYESFENFTTYCLVYFKDREKKVKLHPVQGKADCELEPSNNSQIELLHSSLKELGYKWDSNANKLVKL